MTDFIEHLSIFFRGVMLEDVVIFRLEKERVKWGFLRVRVLLGEWSLFDWNDVVPLLMSNRSKPVSKHSWPCMHWFCPDGRDHDTDKQQTGQHTKSRACRHRSSRRDASASYLIGRELVLRLFYHSVNCMGNTECMRPIMIGNIPIVLANGEDKFHQTFRVEPSLRQRRMSSGSLWSILPIVRQGIHLGQVEEHVENVEWFHIIGHTPGREVELFDVRNLLGKGQGFQAFVFFVGARGVIGQHFQSNFAFLFGTTDTIVERSMMKS